jgi:chloramphenicol 3-O-phosphotransferase
VLNGTSSAGKTSIATAFQRKRSAVEVSLQEDEWLDWCEALDALAPVWVAVHCDVEVAAQREAARGDRAIGLVRGQADVVHRFPAYATEIDTTATPVEEAAQQLADFLASRGPAA